MSHSRIFDEYAKLMSEKGLFKTAEKKDTDYNVVPDKAGSDSKVDETGWELTEIAHPEQVQVAESQLNDGIVENGVEKQKAMIDVALRNPRGVLASLMQTLVKAANVLDADMSEESLKLAKEVDDFLFVLAQQQSQVVLSPAAAKQLDYRHLGAFKAAVEEAVDRFNDLDWSNFWETRDDENAVYGESVVKDALKKLNAFIQTPDADVLNAAHSLSQYINQFYKMVRSAIQKSKDMGDDQNEALMAWDTLKNESDEWLNRGQAASKAPKAAPAESTGPGVASKAPAQSGHRWSVHTPEVGQLQDELGFKGADRDEKFGPKTFAALVEAAKTNSLLDQLMQKMPKTYEGWDNNGVGMALQRIRDSKTSAQAVQAPTAPKSEILDPYASKQLKFLK